MSITLASEAGQVHDKCIASVRLTTKQEYIGHEELCPDWLQYRTGDVESAVKHVRMMQTYDIAPDEALCNIFSKLGDPSARHCITFTEVTQIWKTLSVQINNWSGCFLSSPEEAGQAGVALHPT
eukprot:4106962-Amphidinium_carterae.3